MLSVRNSEMYNQKIAEERDSSDSLSKKTEYQGDGMLFFRNTEICVQKTVENQIHAKTH